MGIRQRPAGGCNGGELRSKRGPVDIVPAQRREKAFRLKSPLLDQPFYRDEHLYVDLRRQVVILDGEAVTLTLREYRLLTLLVEHAGEVVPRSILLMHIWGHVPEIRPSTLDVHIRGLRKKLGVYADHYVGTVIGAGYRFRPFLLRG